MSCNHVICVGYSPLSIFVEFEQEPPEVFISYQWDSQDEVKGLRDRLERSGYSCWMDIGQLGGGDHLYTKIDEALRQCKVCVELLITTTNDMISKAKNKSSNSQLF